MKIQLVSHALCAGLITLTLAAAVHAQSTPPNCGDGVLDKDEGEQCDDGNQANGDGCNEYCELEGRCASNRLGRDAQATTASSVLNGDDANYGADNAADGNSVTYWASEPGAPQWVTIDLSAPRHINRFVAQWEETRVAEPFSAPSSDYEIAISSDGISFTNVYRDPNADGGIDEIAGFDLIGRYVRLTSLANSSPDTVALHELIAYGDDDTSCEPQYCGDDIVDIGEECDDGGQTSTCNADCTLNTANGAQPFGVTQLINSATGTCLEIQGGSTSNAATAVVTSCLDGGDDDKQRFEFLDGPTSGSSLLIAQHSGQCVDVFGASSSDGADVIQWPCHGNPNQDWIPVAASDDSFQLQAAHSGKCLSVNGSNVEQRACAAGDAFQEWSQRFPSPTGIVQLENRSNAECLDVSGYSTDNGANVIGWQCKDSGKANQLFDFQTTAGSNYLLVAQHSNRCVDVAGRSSADGANVLQWDCHGNANQRWLPVPTEGGYFQLQAEHSGKCMTLVGMNVEQQPCTAGDTSQQWIER